MPPPPFLFDADNLALDLLNTAPAVPGAPDLLGAPGEVAAWLAAAGLADEAVQARLAADPPLARVLASEAWALRDALAAATAAFQAGLPVPAPAVFALDRVLAARTTGHGVEAEGARLIRRPLTRVELPLGLLSPVADAAVTLLTEGERTRLRRCAEPTCALWFYDVSRNGRRRWCSMARCGNRAKVAAHYRRQREA